MPKITGVKGGGLGLDNIGARGFFCPLCSHPRPMSQHNLLYRHLEKEHAGASYDCLLCDVSLNGRQECSEHMVQVHPNESDERGVIRKRPRRHAIFESQVMSSYFRLMKGTSGDLEEIEFDGYWRPVPGGTTYAFPYRNCASVGAPSPPPFPFCELPPTQYDAGSPSGYTQNSSPQPHPHTEDQLLNQQYQQGTPGTFSPRWYRADGQPSRASAPPTAPFYGETTLCNNFVPITSQPRQMSSQSPQMGYAMPSFATQAAHHPSPGSLISDEGLHYPSVSNSFEQCTESTHALSSYFGFPQGHLDTTENRQPPAAPPHPSPYQSAPAGSLCSPCSQSGFVHASYQTAAS